MRVAVLSDIHANLEALDAVLASAQEMSCDRIFVLGDIVGYGADPEAVIARIAEQGAVAIAGNHDLAAIGEFDVTWFNESAAAAIRWTKTVMSEEAAGYLRALSPMRPDGRQLLVHGSVRDPAAEYLLSARDAEASFDLAEFALAFFGHTHLPTVFRRDPSGRVGGWVLPEREPIALDDGARYMLNPGSVGQPRDRDPRAAFLVWEDGRATAHRVAYPIERAAAKIRGAGLPAWLADRLFSGE